MTSRFCTCVVITCLERRQGRGIGGMTESLTAGDVRYFPLVSIKLSQDSCRKLSNGTESLLSA